MKNESPKIIIDIDDTLTINNSSDNYSTKKIRPGVAEKIREYRMNGYEIIFFSSRNMRTYNGDVSKINKNTLPILLEWLKENEVEYDGIIMGKPWCGDGGFYVDDKSIRPDEFINLDEAQIQKLITNK
jgi:capsule biosynthesis phosphatase